MAVVATHTIAYLCALSQKTAREEKLVLVLVQVLVLVLVLVLVQVLAHRLSCARVMTKKRVA